jgi:uncharacterized DUF497 family protein
MDISAKFGIPNYEFRLVFGHTKIDYDPDKEGINRNKHGYSLESAVHLLERLLLEPIVLPPSKQTPYAISDAFEEKDEVRHMLMSVDDCGDVVLMVTTMRPDEIVRVLSFRRAHEKERVNFRELTGYVEPKL